MKQTILRKALLMLAILFLMQHSIIIFPTTMEDKTYYEENGISPYSNYPSYDAVIDWCISFK